MSTAVTATLLYHANATGLRTAAQLAEDLAAAPIDTSLLENVYGCTLTSQVGTTNGNEAILTITLDVGSVQRQLRLPSVDAGDTAPFVELYTAQLRAKVNHPVLSDAVSYTTLPQAQLATELNPVEGLATQVTAVVAIPEGSEALPTGSVLFQLNGVTYGNAVILHAGEGQATAVLNIPQAAFQQSNNNLSFIYSGDGNYAPGQGPTAIFVFAAGRKGGT